MEKIKLVIIIILIAFSCAAAFGQDKNTSPAKYTVKFDADGGTPAPKPITVNAGETATLPAGLSKDGHDFAGWFTEKEGGSQWTGNTLVEKNITVYAKWALQKFTVTFNSEGVGAVDPITVEWGKSISTMPTDPQRDNWKFTGWFDSENKPITAETIVKANTEYTAHWEFDDEAVIASIESLRGDIKNLQNNFFVQHFFAIPLATGLLLLLIIASFVFAILKIKSANKKIPSEIQEKIAAIEKAKDAVKKNEKEIENLRLELSGISSSGSARNISVTDNSAQFRDEFSSVNRELSMLKNTVQKLTEEKHIADGIASGSLDTLSVFNNWAAYPSASLPKTFYYIEGDMKIRTKRVLSETANTESKWISNRDGAQKYLLPNPNSFNQMTNIAELYKMDQSKLKGKGQNKIKVTAPCKMSADGFVEFAGELEIL